MSMGIPHAVVTAALSHSAARRVIPSETRRPAERDNLAPSTHARKTQTRALGRGSMPDLNTQSRHWIGHCRHRYSSSARQPTDQPRPTIPCRPTQTSSSRRAKAPASARVCSPSRQYHDDRRRLQRPPAGGTLRGKVQRTAGASSHAARGEGRAVEGGSTDRAQAVRARHSDRQDARAGVRSGTYGRRARSHHRLEAARRRTGA
jgi:hypothetical protein